jgi:hypothetical protein
MNAVRDWFTSSFMLDGAARSPFHEHCRFMNSDHDHGSGTPACVNAER